MTTDEARELIIDGINYAAYRETDSSLHDSDKNRRFGVEHYKSDSFIAQPSPWAEGDFEEKMATLLRWANATQSFCPRVPRHTDPSRTRRLSYWACHPARQTLGLKSPVSSRVFPQPAERNGAAVSAATVRFDSDIAMRRVLLLGSGFAQLMDIAGRFRVVCLSGDGQMRRDLLVTIPKA